MNLFFSFLINNLTISVLYQMLQAVERGLQRASPQWRRGTSVWAKRARAYPARSERRRWGIRAYPASKAGGEPCGLTLAPVEDVLDDRGR